MSKITLYAAGAAVIVLLVIAIFSAGKHSGKLEVAHKLDKLEIKRQKDITDLTLVVTEKQKEIDKKSAKTIEVLRYVKDPNACADVAIPKSVADRLRIR